MEKTALDIITSSWKTYKGDGSTLAVFAFKDENPVLLGLAGGESTKKLQALAKSDGFKGNERETILCRPVDKVPAERMLLIGLGKKADFTLDTLRRAASRIVKGGEALGLNQIAVRAPK